MGPKVLNPNSSVNPRKPTKRLNSLVNPARMLKVEKANSSLSPRVNSKENSLKETSRKKTLKETSKDNQKVPDPKVVMKTKNLTLTEKTSLKKTATLNGTSMVNMKTKKVTTNLPEKKENPKKTLTLKTGKVKTMKTGKVISTRKTTTSTRKTTTSTKKNMKVKDPKKMVTKS